MLVSLQSSAIEDKFLSALGGYEKGHAASAFDVFSELAEKDNNPNAMAILVKMYGEGIGTDVNGSKSIPINGFNV